MSPMQRVTRRRRTGYRFVGVSAGRALGYEGEPYGYVPVEEALGDGLTGERRDDGRRLARGEQCEREERRGR